MLKIEKVNKGFSGKQVLFDIDASIDKGEIIGILGPNGAGKSTTMKILTGFYFPDSGDVKINGESIFKNNNLKKKIGYLPEVNPLYEDMGVDEFLGFTADLKGVKDKEGEIEKILKMVGLEDKKFKFINTLSKGYRQRVGLASALIGDPDILILDEPTEGLDPNQRDEIKQLIKKLGEKKTILISSHVLNEISSIVDRVIIISEGKIKLNDSLKNIETSHKGQMKIDVLFEGKIKLEEIKGKFEEIVEINEKEKGKMEISCNKDIRKDLLKFLISKGEILEFSSYKINLSDVFFETIK